MLSGGAAQAADSTENAQKWGWCFLPSDKGVAVAKFLNWTFDPLQGNCLSGTLFCHSSEGFSHSEPEDIWPLTVSLSLPVNMFWELPLEGMNGEESRAALPLCCRGGNRVTDDSSVPEVCYLERSRPWQGAFQHLRAFTVFCWILLLCLQAVPMPAQLSPLLVPSSPSLPSLKEGKILASSFLPKTQFCLKLMGSGRNQVHWLTTGYSECDTSQSLVYVHFNRRPWFIQINSSLMVKFLFSCSSCGQSPSGLSLWMNS